MANENRIQIKGLNFRYEEDRASAAITPGDLIELHVSTGRKVRRHAAEGGLAERAFAVESPLQGQTAFSIESRTIDTDYAALEVVSYHLAMPGDVIRAHLAPSATATIVGAILHSAGDGSLLNAADLASGSLTTNPVAVAEEALDLSASGAVKSRINVRVL